MTRDEALKRAVAMVERARGYVEDVEFSPMDASRSDVNYLYEVIEAVIGAGATTVNIPDTVGYALPHEFGELIRGIMENVPNVGGARSSPSTVTTTSAWPWPNSLAAIMNGARQVEVYHQRDWRACRERLHGGVGHDTQDQERSDRP